MPTVPELRNKFLLGGSTSTLHSRLCAWKQIHTSQVATGPSQPVAKEEQKHILCICLAYEKKNRHHINRETKRQMQDGC